MDASSYFAAALIGGLLGYIIGDAQREYRLRKAVRENLQRPLYRDTVAQRAAAVRASAVRANTGTNGDSDDDTDGPAWALRSVRDGQARRAAIRRPDHRDSAALDIRGGAPRITTKAPVGVLDDCL